MPEASFSIPTGKWSGFKGYTADPVNAPDNLLAPPSVNALINEQGEAVMRMGFETTSINLSQANKSPRSFYLEQYDVTVFSVGTKLYYYDWNTSTLIDTGASLTDGTICRYDSYAGDVYLTNTTDGLRRLVFMRLNGATSLGGNITVDTDGAARLSVFGITSGNLRIAGTNEAFNGVDVATGVLTATSSAAYTDNTVAVFISDISSGKEKASKPFFWKERMGLIGSQTAGNSDQPNATVYFGKFATVTTLEDIINFTYGAGGSTREIVGTWGKVTNVLPTKDYLYIFKERGSYVASAADVIASGSGIGGTTPELLSPGYGCLNEDCAADMSNGEVVMVTNNNRIMRFKIATDSGAPVLFPDESFDVPMRKLLRLMDPDQTGAHVAYSHTARKLYIHLKIQSQWLVLVWDNAIGAWQPPQNGKVFGAYFERKGQTYALAYGDDAIYLLDNALDDDGIPFECYISTGTFNVDDALIDTVTCKGSISQPTTLHLQPVINGEAQDNTVLGNAFSYGSGDPLGSFTIGSEAYGGELTDTTTAEWKKLLDVYPSEANKIAFRAYSFGSGGYFTLKNYAISGRRFTDSLTPHS